MTSITKKFKLHPKFIVNAIEQQANGLPKAIVELIMNSIDANATEVNIKIWENKSGHIQFEIADNGKGFTKKSIEEYFALFGAPHEEGDATYGKFRIGRGQVFNYATTTWISNSYKLYVDVYKPLREKSDEELGFTFTKLDEKHRGCTISGYVYTNLTESMGSIPHIIDEIHSIIKYIQVPVYINGNKVNISIDDLKQAGETVIEDEYAYYILRPDSISLSVYNIGVWVPYARFRNAIFRGAIISKKQFKITSSRNEIIEDRCELYKNISRNITNSIDHTFIKLSTVKEKKNERFNSSVALSMFKNILKSGIDNCTYDTEAVQMLLNTPINVFTDYKGNRKNLLDLAKAQSVLVLYGSDYDVQIVEKIENKTACLVIEETYDLSSLFVNTRERLLEEYAKRNESPDPDIIYDDIPLTLNLFGFIRQLVTEYTDIELNDQVYLSYKDEKEKVAFNRKIIDQAKLNKKEKQFLEFLQKMNDLFCESYPDFINDCYGKREIFLGKSELDNAWTNMTSNIVFDVRTLTMYEQHLFQRLLFILIHEYAHLLDDEDGHDFIFYERFHEFIIRNDFSKLLDKLTSGAKGNNDVDPAHTLTKIAPDQAEEMLLAMIDEPSQVNARELYHLLHDLNYSFTLTEEGKKTKELFGLSYDTFNAWLADPKSTRYRNPKLQTWQCFIYEIIAKKRGFKDFNAMVLSTVFNGSTSTEENI